MSFNIAAKVNNLSVTTSNILDELAEAQTELDSILSNYVTNTSLSSTLAYYTTNSALTTILGAYETVNNNITMLALKADKLTTYTKTDIDTSLALKSNITYVDTALNTKQDTLIQNALATGVTLIDASNNIRRIFGVSPVEVNVYFDPPVPTDTKNNQIQISFDNTLDTLTNYYTMTASDAKYQLQLSATSPLSLTNNTLSINLSDYATLAYVATAISNLVSSAPSVLDTLNELALALGSDPNFATTITNLVATKQTKITTFSSPILYSNNTLSFDSTVNN